MPRLPSAGTDTGARRFHDMAESRSDPPLRLKGTSKGDVVVISLDDAAAFLPMA